MRVQQILVPALVCLAAACAHTPPANPVAPKAGPKASIRALYDGGLLRRRVSAVFSVSEPSYVLVAHLGGDGVISVVYPTRAGNAWAARNEVYRTAAFAGDYDAAPEYYFMTVSTLRSPAARTYSYDGRGHGFVFMITSRTPFRIEQISDYGSWDDIEVVDYLRMLDPRRAIKEYADMLTGGSKYSITYAQSFTAYSYTSYADAVWDCALFGSRAPWRPGLALAFAGIAGVGPNWWMSPGGAFGYGSAYGYGYGSSGYCDSGYSYAYGYSGYYGWTPRPVASVPVTNPIPTTPVAQRTPRPTFYPSTPADRRTSERRTTTGTFSSGGSARRDVLSYRPTRSENPTFAPVPVERSLPRWPVTSYGTRPSDPSRREWVDRNAATNSRPNTSTTTSSKPAPSTTTSSTPSSTPSTAKQPQPTMSPSHSEPSRRPPTE